MNTRPAQFKIPPTCPGSRVVGQRPCFSPMAYFVDARDAPTTSDGPRSTTIAPRRERAPPIPTTNILISILITLWSSAGGVRRDPPARESERATPTSLLLLRLVPSFDRDHGPEDLEQAEADEEERAPGQRELREGARLARRPARGKASEYARTPSTRRRVRLLDGVAGASSTPPRRGPPVDCRTGATGRPPCRRRWTYLL